MWAKIADFRADEIDVIDEFDEGEEPFYDLENAKQLEAEVEVEVA
jgi:hypothetical protein